jgi:hypothetical protein
MRDDDGAQLVDDHAAIETACGGARAAPACSPAAPPADSGMATVVRVNGPRRA